MIAVDIDVVHKTTVVSVRGQRPQEWLSNANHVYVGRDSWLRSGAYAGETWPNSGFGNPFKFEPDFMRDEKIQSLFNYVRWLHGMLNVRENQSLRNKFLAMHGRTLGCWCVEWNGTGKVPLCHAAWLARIVDLFAKPESTGVMVLNDGRIEPWDGRFGNDRVVFRKLSK